MARLLLATLTSRLPPRRTIVLTIIVLCALLTALLIYLCLALVFGIALPLRRAYYLETSYLYNLGVTGFEDVLQSRSTASASSSTPPRKRPVGLVEDVPQLHNWPIPTSVTYDVWLGLWNDGTGYGEYKGREYWIYFGGTNSSSAASTSSSNDTSVFQHRYKEHSCVDPLEICEAYNRAFDDISARWHGKSQRPYPSYPATSAALLRYVDCDVSPLLCSVNFGLGIRPVVLAHLKIGDVCDKSLPWGTERCPVTWRFFGLPMRALPWTRTVRIQLDSGGYTVVPAFPDAREQMWTLMSQDGAEEGMEYLDPDLSTSKTNYSVNTRTRVDPIPGQSRAHWPQRRGLDYWGFMAGMLFKNPLGIPRELMVRCYLMRWLDLFLNWWDGPPHVAYPQKCAGIEAARERSIKLAAARRDLIDNYNVNPRNVFIEDTT